MEILVGWWFAFAIIALVVGILAGGFKVADILHDLRRGYAYGRNILDLRHELKFWLICLYASPIIALLWPISVIVIGGVVFRRTWAYTVPTREEREAEIRRLERQLHELD